MPGGDSRSGQRSHCPHHIGFRQCKRLKLFFEKERYNHPKGGHISKIIKYGKDLAIIIPEDLVKKLDIRPDTPIRIYEITAGTVAIEKVKLAPLSDSEVALLQKLLQVKFEDRTPEKVDSTLSPSEKKTVGDLVKRHLLTIYYGGKYAKSGVYNVPNLVYRQITERLKPEAKQVQAVPKIDLERSKTVEKQIKKELKEEKREETDPIKRLNKEGYIVLQSEADAKNISDVLSEKIKKNQVTGIRGFDKKYYIVKSSFVLKYQSKVKSVLKDGAKPADKIAEILEIRPEATVALLTVLREEGELIEKRKGTFALAD